MMWLLKGMRFFPETVKFPAREEPSPAPEVTDPDPFDLEPEPVPPPDEDEPEPQDVPEPVVDEPTDEPAPAPTPTPAPAQTSEQMLEAMRQDISRMQATIGRQGQELDLYRAMVAGTPARPPAAPAEPTQPRGPYTDEDNDRFMSDPAAFLNQAYVQFLESAREIARTEVQNDKQFTRYEEFCRKSYYDANPEHSEFPALVQAATYKVASERPKAQPHTLLGDIAKTVNDELTRIRGAAPVTPRPPKIHQPGPQTPRRKKTPSDAEFDTTLAFIDEGN